MNSTNDIFVARFVSTIERKQIQCITGNAHMLQDHMINDPIEMQCFFEPIVQYIQYQIITEHNGGGNFYD